MLKYIKAVSECDSCGSNDESLVGDPFRSYTGRIADLDEIVKHIHWTVPYGWVKDSEYKLFCPKCHMKKEPKTI